MVGLSAGRAGGARGDVVEAILLDGFRHGASVDGAASRQLLQRAHHDRRTVDGEEAPGGGSRVTEAEAVGSEGGVVARHERANLVGHCVHEVGDRDKRSFSPEQFARDVRDLRFFGRAQEIVLFGGQAVSSQLVPRRDAPHVGRNVPIFGQQLLRFEGPWHSNP